jgi:hypothetical protein
VIAVRWRGAVLAGAAVALAFWAGTRVSRPAAPVSQRVVVERAIPVVSSGGLTREDIRAVVREELEAHAGGPIAQAPAEAAIEQAPIDPDGAHRPGPASAVDAASQAVAAGIAHGVWGEAERAALRVQLVQLDAAQTREVLTPLFRAINAHQLELDGPPL